MSASRGTSSQSLDPVKVNQIFDKIYQSNNLEIEERNLKSLAQKVSLKLLDCGYLINNHSSQIMRLFEWLNHRASAVLNGAPGGPPGTVCSMQAIQNFTSIFLEISLHMEGRALILHAGGKELFSTLIGQLPQSEFQIAQMIEKIMNNIVEGEAGTTLHLTATNPFARHEAVVSQQEHEMDIRSEYTAGGNQSVAGFSRRDFTMNGGGHQRVQTTNVQQNTFARETIMEGASSVNIQAAAIRAQRHQSHDSQFSSGRLTGSSQLQTMMLQSGVNQNHMEIMHKQQILKEQCELPFIFLSEQDEKELFDLSVALKFGNPQTIFLSCQRVQVLLLHDFPPEVFLQRTDILKSLLDLLEGGAVNQEAANQSVQHWDTTSLAQQCLITYLSKLKNVYRFLLHNQTKPNVMDRTAQMNPEGLDSLCDAYIEKTYPCNRLSRWEDTSNPYSSQSSRRSHSSQPSIAPGGQNSLSCRAVLGLILTKSIYLLQDSERIGLFVQLINKALECLLHVFKVTANQEFSEFLHLCLFAFDKVCEFYKEQLFEEVLIQPALEILIKIVGFLNQVPSSEDVASNHNTERSYSENSLALRFKQPFTDTLFKNTENLQRTLRRALFRYQFSEEHEQEKYQSILRFFERLETSNHIDQSNMMQKNVQKSFFKAQSCFAKFVRVTEFRLQNENSLGQEQACFVASQPAFHEAIQMLQDLTECGIELKLDFPFEHLLVDCIMYAGMLEETGGTSRLAEIEKLCQTFLAIPIPEIRERILRRIYQKLRVSASANMSMTSNYGGVNQGPKALQNILYLGQFILRKGILNHFVNGILINREIAECEESRLQMSIGQLIVKIIILAFNEVQSSGQATQGSTIAVSINNFLLTFQCLLPQYNELISLIELIEEGGQKNCRYLRILRDLFSSLDHKREFATNVLRSSFSMDCKEEHIKDMLKNSIDLRQPSFRVAQNLDLVNSNFDFSSFGIQDITNILQSPQQDFSIKKTSLEQLTMVLFDVQNKRGRFMFSQCEAAQDVFTFVLDEVLLAYESSKNCKICQVSSLPKERIWFINECLRFMVYSYIFFNDEEVVQTFFNKVKVMASAKKPNTVDHLAGKFEQLLTALVYLMGSSMLRENCMLLLYIAVYQQLWICTKVQKGQAPNGQIIRNISVLIPDFCQESLYQLIPYTVQSIRMPGRDDLMLSEEQKTYIEYRFNAGHRFGLEMRQLEAVSEQLITTIEEMRAQDYRQTLVVGVAVWKNYLMSLESMREPLVHKHVFGALIELLKVLPTRDYEFYDLGDYLCSLTMIMHSHQRMLATPESKALFDDFLLRLMDGLRYHIMPYLEETGVSGIVENAEFCPKTYLIFRYVEFLYQLLTCDMARVRGSQSVTKDALSRTSFMQFLINCFHFYRGNMVMRKELLNLFQLIVSNFSFSDYTINQQISDLLVDQVSTVKMIFNQFDQASVVMQCIRIMLVLNKRRLLRIQTRLDDEEDQAFSHTAKSKLEQFQSFGWIMRFTETRDARIRVLTWDLLTELFDYEFLRSHPSVVHQSINTFLKNNELYCVKISALKFLNKVCDSLIKNCENTDLQDIYGQGTPSNVEQMTVATLLQTLNRQGLISQIHKILSNKDCPLLFLTLTLQLLHSLTQMDYKKAIPVLTQLDYWTFLVELLDIEALTQIERQESRPILRDLRQSGILNYQDSCHSLDLVYMALNSILDFLFEAFKRDSQLAALLVKTTKLMQSVFFLVLHTLDNFRKDQAAGGSFNRRNSQTALRLQNRGMLTVFIDKVVKILHVAMLHPQDFSVDLISKFIFDQPLSADQTRPDSRNWLYFIEMFQIIEQFNQTSDFTDIKLALIRFISEFLIQTAHFTNNFLDELITMKCNVLVSQGEEPQYEANLETYGSQLFIEFAKVFKYLYIDARGNPSEAENQKRDITICLQVLLASCQSAKNMAVEQNFLKKVVDICSENASAIYLGELQKFAQKGSKKQMSQALFEQQLNRQFRYVNQEHDLEECEREVIRMMQLVRNLFYDSNNLLLAFVENTFDASVVGPKPLKPKKESQSDKLINVFAQILEELGSQKQFENLICESLMTMITFASQNQRFKNCFVQQVNVSTQSKKVHVLKIVCDKINSLGNLQSNSKQLRLLFTLLRSLSLSAEITKEIMKLKFVEETADRIMPQCKNDKDIKLFKYYLTHFMSFLSAFTLTEEGCRQIVKTRQAFELSFFLLDTVTIPAVPDASISQGEFNMSPVQQLISAILLFFRNATKENRVNKVHFIKNQEFLPCLLSFLSTPNQHPKIKAYTSAVLWALVHGHQGIKAAINKPSVVSELQLMRSEYQRLVDKEQWVSYSNTESAVQQTEKEKEIGANLEFHTDYTLGSNARMVERNKAMTRDMNAFVLKALTGILILVQA